MFKIENTIDSREVADMVEKNHKDLMRDIRRYVEQLTERKIAPSDFFRESTYKDSTGRSLPCYQITKERMRVYRSQTDRSQGGQSSPLGISIVSTRWKTL